MRVLRWIVVIAGIALLWWFGLRAGGAGLTEDGGLTADALKNLFMVAVTYLSVRLFFKTID